MHKWKERIQVGELLELLSAQYVHAARRRVGQYQRRLQARRLPALELADHVFTRDPLPGRLDADLDDRVLGWIQNRQHGTRRHERHFMLPGTSAKDESDLQFLASVHSRLTL